MSLILENVLSFDFARDGTFCFNDHLSKPAAQIEQQY